MRDAIIGTAGTLASFGLTEMNLALSIAAGLSTTIYMIISILRDAKKK